ncbi:hypothetical protein GQ457_09G017340 [Hibiscus cannabinus]
MPKSDELEKQERTLKEITIDLDTVVRRLDSIITRIDQNEIAVEILTQTVAKLNANTHDDTSDDEIRRPNLFPIENRRQQHQTRRDNRFNDQRRAVHDQTKLPKPKFTIPSFQGKYDPDAYFDWQKKVNFMFEYYRCPKEDQVPILALEFTDYAAIRWSQLVRTRPQNGETTIKSWEEL